MHSIKEKKNVYAKIQVKHTKILEFWRYANSELVRKSWTVNETILATLCINFTFQ